VVKNLAFIHQYITHIVYQVYNNRPTITHIVY